MARKYIKELGDKKSHGIAATEGDRVKTIAPVYYMPSDSSSDSDVKGIQTELDKKEDKTNKTTGIRAASSASDTLYPTEKAVATALADKATKQVRLQFTLSASSTKYVKILTSGSAYRQWICSYNANSGSWNATWIFRSYASGQSSRDQITLISGNCIERPWYSVAATTWYVKFQNTDSQAYTIVFNVASIDTSELPTLTAVDTLPDGASAITVYGVKYAEQLRTARQLAVSLSNTGTTTTFDGSANVTNIKVSGTLGVGNGGTGKSSVTTGNYLVGNGSSALTEKTPAQVLSDIGAQAALSFEGTYNASSNKVATVSTVTNAINALDVPASGTGAITGMGAGKTLASLTETNGKVAATFQDISITKSQVSDFSHAHGDISNAGCVQHSGDVAISADDKILIADKSASNKVQRSAITFDGSTTTTALTPKGTWESFAKAADITSAVEALDAEVTSSDGKNVNVKVTETNGKVTAVNVTTDTTANIANSVYYVVGALPFNTYSASATYTKYESGAYTTSNACIYNNYAYYCSTAITTAEAWNSSHWTRIATVVFTASIPEVTDMVAGLKIAFKFPCYGGSTSTQLAINTFAAKDLRRNTDNITTHVPPNAVAFFAYNGTYWSWADYYSDSWVTSMGAYCDTAAGTAAKTATSSNTVLTVGMAFLTRFTKTNTYAGKLTLNVNSQGAKDVYINGSISSSTNYTLPAGEHWCFYDGTNWNIWTDGTVQYKSLVVNGVHSDSYYASNLCKYFETDKYPTNVVIWTKCKWVSGSYMPVIRIYGNDYQRGGAWELKVAFYIYNDAFTNAGTTSIGSVAPSVYLWKYTDTADNKDYVAVGLTTDTAWANSQWYFRGFQVDVQLPASGNWSAINRTGWTTSSNGADTTQTIIPEVGTSKCVEAPYVSLHTTVSKASKLSTARELAVSLSNTSTTTTFDGSANVTNIKTTGTLGIANGGTGATTKKAAEFAICGNMAQATAAMADNIQFVFSRVGSDQNATNGVFIYRTASTIWDYMKGKIKADSHCLDSDDAIDIWNSI